MSTVVIKEMELPNEIRTINEKTPLLLGQNFDAIIAKLNEISNYINNNVAAIVESSGEQISDAITYGTEEPV